LDLENNTLDEFSLFLQSITIRGEFSTISQVLNATLPEWACYGCKTMGVWQGVAMDSLKILLGLPIPAMPDPFRPCGQATPEAA
jgi:hypothetical protein